MLCLKILRSIFVTFLSYLVLISFVNAETVYKVKSTDSLSRIANKFYKGSKLSQHQIFIGILAENPNAFSLGNINLLKNGQQLSLPDSKNLLAMEPKDATRLVAEHNNNANKGRKTRLSPPFKDYIPKTNGANSGANSAANSNDIKALAEKQQVASDKLQKLGSESEQLRIRLQQLEADKKAMDDELLLLNNLIKE